MLGLILALIGATISFILLLLDNRENKSKVVVLSLAVAGFLVVTGQQFISYFSAKASEQIINDIDRTTKKIDTTTSSIDSSITVLALIMEKANRTSVDKIGVAVTDYSSVTGLRRHDKESAHKWYGYRDWLMEEKDEKSSLVITVGQKRKYNYGLIILYCLLDENNGEFIETQIENNSFWSGFPNEEDKAVIRKSEPYCDLVLFENESGELLAFAETKAFLLDLIQIEDRKRMLEESLWREDGGKSFLQFSNQSMVSIQKPANGNTLPEVSQSMIDNNVGATVSDFSEGRFYFQLSSLLVLE